MSNSKIPIIYLLGAGRSGTTVLATVMDIHPKIHTAGELHQFFDHVLENKDCSCGKGLATCTFWHKVIEKYQGPKSELEYWRGLVEKKEAHYNIPKYLLVKKGYKVYSDIQEILFDNISKQTKGQWILDSSKYIGRYLLLKRSKGLNVKGVYVVRDVRGVISSFKKKVQSSRSPLSAIFYYVTINTFAQWVCWLDKSVIKVRYEDFMRDPQEVLQQVCSKISPELKETLTLPDKFDMPHIIGGNRMRSQKNISLSFDQKWKADLTKSQKILYYCLASPFMILNKYRP